MTIKEDMAYHHWMTTREDMVYYHQQMKDPLPTVKTPMSTGMDHPPDMRITQMSTVMDHPQDMRTHNNRSITKHCQAPGVNLILAKFRGPTALATLLKMEEAMDMPGKGKTA